MFFCTRTIHTCLLKHAPQIHSSRFTRTLLVLALLGASISDTNPVHAADDNSEAMAKILKQRSLAATPTPDSTGASTTGTRESVDREIRSGSALLDVLKRQNTEKSAGKDVDISVIEGTISDASSALNAGNIALAKELIHEANAMTRRIISEMQLDAGAKPDGAAVTLAPQRSSPASPEANLQKDYAKRKNTVAALLDSAKRIDAEHGTSHPAFAKTEAMFNEADKLAAAGNFTEGKARLDSAYLMLKEAMRDMLSRKKGGK